MTIELHNIDCMEYMRGLPDNAFELAIVDPPYGIGESGGKARTRKKHVNRVIHARKNWDILPPPAEYFSELRRVSENQIIWGANYYPEHLSPSMGWIYWDKKIGGDFRGHGRHTTINSRPISEESWQRRDVDAILGANSTKLFLCGPLDARTQSPPRQEGRSGPWSVFFFDPVTRLPP